MSVGLVASGMSSASAVDTSPRAGNNAAGCAKAAEEGYTTNGEVEVDNYKFTCRIKKNGQWQWTKKKGNKCIKVKTSFKKLRGDVRRDVTYTFMKGNRVITKSVRIKSGKRSKVKICLPKKGKWGVLAEYRGSTISNVVKA
jgi:hypothetical protein